MNELIMNSDKFKNNLIELINNSNLPAFLIFEILQNILIEIEKAKNIELENAKKEDN